MVDRRENARRFGGVVENKQHFAAVEGITFDFVGQILVGILRVDYHQDVKIVGEVFRGFDVLYSVKLFELFDNLPFLTDDVVVDDGVEDRQRGNDAKFFAGMCKFEYFLGNILFQKVLSLQGEKRNGLTIVNRIG